MSKKAFVGLLVLAVLLVLLVLFFGNLIWGETWQVPSQFNYDVLKDTLTIVLSVSAVVIAILGYLVYLIMSERLRADTALTSRVESLKVSVRLFLISGYTYWEYYDAATTKIPKHLVMAIEQTERALQTYNLLPEKDAKKPDMERECYLIKNNLAYYFAERRNKDDRERAIKYAEDIRDGISRFPKEKENWLDTYSFVKKQYKV